MIMNTKLDLTGTYEDAMNAINEAPITDEFKAHLWAKYHKDYDEVWNSTRGIDLDTYYEKRSIPVHELVPKGMTIKEYFSK